MAKRGKSARSERRVTETRERKTAAKARRRADAAARKPSPPSFKDRYRDVQELVREMIYLNTWNKRFKDGDPQDEMLLFAEAGVVLMTLERFVRIVVGVTPDDRRTLQTLLEQAVARGLLKLPWDDQQDGIRKVCAIRNTILHGNFEQAAAGANQPDVRAFFKTQFAGEVETMMTIVDYLMKQIDPISGPPAPQGTQP
jgi:hypothetical protein